MPHPRSAFLQDRYGDLVALTSDAGAETGVGTGGSPLAVVGFFVGWSAVGVVVALALARRGHDHRLMIALGVGLGPLMILKASDTVCHREATARPLVLEPGVDRGGPLDVLVLVEGAPDDVRSIVPTLEAVRGDLGTLTLALWPGTAPRVAERFRRRHPHGLVLTTIGERAAGTTPPGTW